MPVPNPPYENVALGTAYTSGWIIHPVNNIIPNRLFTAVELPNGDKTALAGEVVLNGKFIGLLETDVDGDLSEYRDLLVNCIAIVKKTTGVGNDIADGDYITYVANPTATKNDLFAQTSGAAAAIHAIALEDAAEAATTVMVYHMGVAPYHTTAP